MMITNKIAIACDHAGVELKAFIKEFISPDITMVDLGTDGPDSVDYPDYAIKLANYLDANPDAYGILICGTGIGISIAANRFFHIRAGLCHNSEVAKLTRLHNDANVLVLGARVVDQKMAKNIIMSFFNTEFEGDRHLKRVKKLGISNDFSKE